jgi:hypothetical protein
MEYLVEIRQNQSSAYLITMNETAGVDLIKYISASQRVARVQCRSSCSNF